jgi:hypothetical protein
MRAVIKAHYTKMLTVARLTTLQEKFKNKLEITKMADGSALIKCVWLRGEIPFTPDNFKKALNRCGILKKQILKWSEISSEFRA